MFTMWFDGGLIPRYMVVRKLGMLDTRAALILPAAMSTFNFIIMRTALSEVPDGLVESATIDGAGHLTIMFRIVMPVTKATIAVIALYYAVGIWNSWFAANIYLIRARHLRPLQLVLRDILINADTNSINVPSDASSAADLYRPLVQYTTIVIATVPILAVYPFIQKYFVTGVMLGSIKG
jgi:putative aldouronate transport system permease protein